MEAANCSFDNVVKTTVLLADINDFAAVNEVYKTFFRSNYPARAAYQVQTAETVGSGVEKSKNVKKSGNFHKGRGVKPVPHFFKFKKHFKLF